MEIGENGVRGAHAVRHVKKESSLELVNAIHQRLSTVENNARGIPARTPLVTRMFLVQVKKYICR